MGVSEFLEAFGVPAEMRNREEDMCVIDVGAGGSMDAAGEALAEFLV